VATASDGAGLIRTFSNNARGDSCSRSLASLLKRLFGRPDRTLVSRHIKAVSARQLGGAFRTSSRQSESGHHPRRAPLAVKCHSEANHREGLRVVAAAPDSKRGRPREPDWRWPPEHLRVGGRYEQISSRTSTRHRGTAQDWKT